jgi:NTE family protein
LPESLDAPLETERRWNVTVLDFVKLNRRDKAPLDEDPTPSLPEPKRPLIGLALGGGAARGFAHIGVIRTLLKHGITPDVISGTSIGAVVGGLYAAGRLEAVETWARSLTRRRVFGYMDFSIAGSGLIGGGRLAQLLAREVSGVNVEELSPKFAAIATEIGSGHEVWLTRGRLSDAISASYALPGIFPPSRIGGRWLMDGALVNPVPVSAARALGARVVISVNLNFYQFGLGTTIQDHGTDEIEFRPVSEPKQGLHLKARRILKRQMVGTGEGQPGLPTVMVEAFNIMQDRITRARLAGDPPDIAINPRLAEVSFFDFHRAAESIELGAEATERSLEMIHEAISALA